MKNCECPAKRHSNLARPAGKIKAELFTLHFMRLSCCTLYASIPQGRQAFGKRNSAPSVLPASSYAHCCAVRLNLLHGDILNAVAIQSFLFTMKRFPMSCRKFAKALSKLGYSDIDIHCSRPNKKRADEQDKPQNTFTGQISYSSKKHSLC